jgi:glycosyltransferase involved in cell wall biosynthesis
MEGGRVQAAEDVLRVGVLVDLARRPESGGHVKCWERLAAAAADVAGLDLAVHFAGPGEGSERIAPNVRFIYEKPVFSTARLRFLLGEVPDDTDLAPWHPRLARFLPGYDVVHTTDAFFAYARTAIRSGRPLVNSVHTNTPEYARLYAARSFARLGLARLHLERLVERRMRARLAAHQRRCAFALVSRPDELAATAALTGGHAGLLRRGVDTSFFTPAKRRRAADGRVVVLYAGRVDAGKNVGVLLDAVAASGPEVHLLCAGEGPMRAEILARLGPRAVCPGNLDPAALAQAYASADLFAFPSMIEEHANVVQEALASGLPVLATPSMARAIEPGVTGLVLQGDDKRAWAEAIAALSAERRAEMGRAARAWAESRLPTWRDVLIEDLLPRWREAARR